MHLRSKMQDDQDDDIWLSGPYYERGTITTKQLLTPNIEYRCTIGDNINPERTTAGSAQDCSPSGSDQRDTEASTQAPRHEDISRNVNVSQSGVAGVEAGLTNYSSSLASVWKTAYQSGEKSDPIVHHQNAKGGLTETCKVRAKISTDDELQAFSRKLKQALLEVKREAEDGFLTAKASVYRRLVEQLNADREKELQRLEEARQEAESARTLLVSLRKSKEATEEKLSRMFIFVRRRMLRQQARQQQQEALNRWRCFAVRRKRQRREQAFVTAAGERARIWRVFFPWRIAALETASARLQQSAARHAQAAMDNQLRLAQVEKAQQEQVVQQLRHQLQTEIATRMRLQENLCQIFLQGASAVYGSKDGCRGVLSRNITMCPMVQVANLTGQNTFHSTGMNTGVPTKLQAAPPSTENQPFGSRGNETATKEAMVGMVGKPQREEEAPTKLRVGAVQGSGVTGQQRSMNFSKKGSLSPMTYNAVRTKPISVGHVLEGTRRVSPCAPTGQSAQILNVKSQQIQGCPTESNSLEVIGQMLEPHLLSGSLSAKAAALSDTSMAASSLEVPFSCSEAISRTCYRERWHNAGAPDNVHPHECHNQVVRKGEWCVNRCFGRHHSTVNVRADQSPAMRRRHVRLGIAGRREKADASTFSSAHVPDHVSCEPCVNRSYANLRETIPVILPSDQDNVGYGPDEKRRARTSKSSEATEGTCEKPVRHFAGRCGKAAANPSRSTLIYPGGVEANQRNGRCTLYAVASATQNSVGCKVRTTGKTNPPAYPPCPKLDTGAKMLLSKKDCSWVQSC